MITLLEDVLKRADGAYLDSQDLGRLDHCFATWNDRKEVYAALQEKENDIIQDALALMRQSDRFTAKPINDLGVGRCHRDLVFGLRCCALAMLLQDEYLLKDRVLYWQRNIFLSLQLNYQGYKLLLEAIKNQLKPAQVEIIAPYLKVAHEIMSGT